MSDSPSGAQSDALGTGFLGAWPDWDAVATPLALHLLVGEKAARDAAGTPRFAVGPAAHAGLPLVPHEDGARLDQLALLVREAALDPGQEAAAAGLEENDGIGRAAHEAFVRFHGRERIFLESSVDSSEAGAEGLEEHRHLTAS